MRRREFIAALRGAAVAGPLAARAAGSGQRSRWLVSFIAHRRARLRAPLRDSVGA
jgi:hypothetical protein